jgi:hypothetical protein
MSQSPVSASGPALPDLASLPHTWRSALGETPSVYRSALLAHTLAVIERIGLDGAPARGSLGHDIAVEFTGLSILQSSAFIPYHLLDAAEQDQTIAVMERLGPGAVLAHARAGAGEARTALIVGDISPTAAFDAEIDRIRGSIKIGTFVAGPGPDIEGALRAYATTRDIPRAFLRAVDTRRGATWSSSPGALLDALVSELFTQHHPDVVVVFEPTRLPSTLFVLDQARHLGLHVEHVELAKPR